MKKLWKNKKFKLYRKWTFRISMVFFLIWYSTCLPTILFNKPTSLVLVSDTQNLLAAHVADDGQWRFPETDSINPKFAKAIVVYEDKRFYEHIGVDIWAILRALKSNISSGEVVSGASTLSMQVIRLSRNNPDRTIWEKIGEMFRATRLEMRYSKKEILNLYASHAPFGGNVVGIDAASWKYFGKSQDKLTWAEAAMLAVLPNAPSLIHLGKNRNKLLKKRNSLLNKLLKEGYLDKVTCDLAKMEPLPHKPKDIPQITPHLLDYFLKKRKQGKIITSLDYHLQKDIMSKLNYQAHNLESIAVYNASVLVVEVETGEIKAYVGNLEGNQNENAVDMNQARRSTGSILKPLLYAEMLEEGKILPHSLIADIPVDYQGYEPENYNLTYDGAIPASQMVSKSLNIPAVNMLNEYGVNRFIMDLKSYGFHSINKSSSYYGLPLILGGAEVSPIELAKVYTSMSQKLNRQNQNVSFIKDDTSSNKHHSYLPNETAIYQMYQAMLEVKRPNEDKSWKVFGTPQKIAWKTGTSFGGRDAWAIGCTPKYTVVIWTGNADGEGRPNLTGFSAASPILFDVFSSLEIDNSWFEEPSNNEILVCNKSGFKANRYCTHTHKQKVTVKGLDSYPCGHCLQISMDSSESFRVEGTDYPPMDRINKTFFVLQPDQAFYYEKKHANYTHLPPTLGQVGSINLEYPKQNAKIYLPRIDSNKRSSMVLKATSTEKTDQLYWSLDNEFIGTTESDHEIAIQPEKGKHNLLVTNASGSRVQIKFEIIE